VAAAGELGRVEKGTPAVAKRKEGKNINRQSGNQRDIRIKVQSEKNEEKGRGRKKNNYNKGRLSVSPAVRDSKEGRCLGNW